MRGRVASTGTGLSRHDSAQFHDCKEAADMLSWAVTIAVQYRWPFRGPHVETSEANVLALVG